MEQNSRRKFIERYFELNRDKSNYVIVCELRDVKISPRTIYRHLKRLRNNETLNRKKGSGRRPWKVTPRRMTQLVKNCNKKSITYAAIARKYSLSRTHIKNLLKKNNIRRFSTKVVPKSTPEQRLRQLERLKRLYYGSVREKPRKFFILDDESYFSFENPRSSFYLSDDKENVPDNIKYREKSKFGQKVCVWLAVSEKGISKPHFFRANCAINGQIYLKDCIRANLVPFIEKFHSDGKYLFWPDGASAHYHKDVVAHFREKGINFVEKDNNPPNLPQLRPIELFWAHLKQKVYEKNWSAKNYRSLKMRIIHALKKFDTEYFKRLFKNFEIKMNLQIDIISKQIEQSTN